ncbi:MAG: sulfatase-like hydrolase/transferase, partial [Planctomycetota bacterium]|nr:sulfatase-like hydrolase/transferase [Planctomycetota bacterium]
MPDEARHHQTRTFDRGLEFLDDNHRTDNWFLQIESFDPHEPFFAAERFRDLFPDDYTGALSDWPKYGDVDANNCAHMVDHWRNAYASLLAQCDASLGRVLDKMDALDLWSDTMLIVNTDHGFLLGEHNHTAKNVMPLWQELANTPLFVWDPRAGRRDERCDCLTS